jgi:succinate dehydrogenase/fumarate reductase flavoprotein subunit
MRERHVVVVGSGGAGMAAAASAALAGANVTVLESQAAIGGTTAISGGAVWMPATRWQAECGIADTPSEGLRYLERIALGDADPALAHVYVTEGPGVFEAIERDTRLAWHHMSGFPDYHPEHEGGNADGRGLEIMPVELSDEVRELIRPDPYRVPPARIAEAGAGEPDPRELRRRIEGGILARGPGLIGGLASAVLDHGGAIRTGVRVQKLILEDGTVTGVEVDSEAILGAVVIATGGFERNPELVRRFLRGPVLAPASPPGNQGDGLTMGMAAGAAIGNMSEAWWCPAMEDLGEQIDGAPFFRMMFTDCAHPGGILVDGRGRRFVNEAANYNDLGRAFHGFDAGWYDFPAARAWLVFDETRRSERGFVGDTVWSISPAGQDRPETTTDRDERPPVWMKSADTIGELAEEIGVSAEGLSATITEYNTAVKAGVDFAFGRGSFIYDRFSQGGMGLRGVERAPFHAIRVLPGALGTKGGLKIDGDGRVLRLNATSEIPGLYAAGNASANPFGLAYPGPGATVGPAVVFGWRAGSAAAAD